MGIVMLIVKTVHLIMVIAKADGITAIAMFTVVFLVVTEAMAQWTRLI